MEGILEFRLLTHNFSAEYGRNAGGVVSAVTRSGTNEFHGSAYEFVRNNIFDARNFFNPGALPAFRRNQFGAAAGGRIIKDRIFFFANYEGLRQRQGNTVIAAVPDLNARQGDSAHRQHHGQSGCGALLAQSISAAERPQPRRRDGGLHRNFSTPATEDYAMERMDFRLSDKDNFYWRYVYDPVLRRGSLCPTVFSTTPLHDRPPCRPERNAHFFRSLVKRIPFAFNRTTADSRSAPRRLPIDPSLSFVPGQPLGTISFSAVRAQSAECSRLSENPRAAAPWQVQNLFQETDTFSIVRGAHSLKFGVDLERQQINNYYVQPYSQRGPTLFGGLRVLLAGPPSTFQSFADSAAPALTSVDGGASVWRFVQDDYRIRPNLTLNLGLREEFFTESLGGERLERRTCAT